MTSQYCTEQTYIHTLPALRSRLREPPSAVIRARKLRLPPRTTAVVGSKIINRTRDYTFHCYLFSDNSANQCRQLNRERTAPAVAVEAAKTTTTTAVAALAVAKVDVVEIAAEAVAVGVVESKISRSLAKE